MLDNAENVLVRTIQHLSDILDDKMDQIDLGRGIRDYHVEILYVLWCMGEADMYEVQSLYKRVSSGYNSFTRHIRELEKLGVLARYISPDDGRKVVIKLTELGRQKQDEAVNAYIEACHAVVRALGEEAEALVQLGRRMSC